MPNHGSKSNGGKSKGVGNARHQSTTGRGSNGANEERSDVKQGTDKKGSFGWWSIIIQSL